MIVPISVSETYNKFEDLMKDIEKTKGQKRVYAIIKNGKLEFDFEVVKK